jgi:hypothetical protein
MSTGIDVGPEALHAAATHRAAAFQQGMTAQQQREMERTIEQSTREQVQRAVAAAQEAAKAARAAHASELSQVPAVPPVPPVPPAPPVPVPDAPVTGVAVLPNGERIVIGDARQPFATITKAGSGQNVHFYAPNVPIEIVIIVVTICVMLVLVAVGMPLARAYARRMDRQGGRAEPSPFPSDVSDRIQRIEQAVEAIAIEVERVSEGQRFTTKMLSELRAPALASSSQFTGEKR